MSTEFSESILRWYETNGRKRLPWKVKDPYKIWISEIMLQQTQVATVIPYYNKFVDTYPDLQSLSKASLDELMLLWSGLGYYRRIKNIYLAAQIISRSMIISFQKTMRIFYLFLELVEQRPQLYLHSQVILIERYLMVM